MATLGENKKAYADYEVLETYDAGIELFGHEVKSLRLKHGLLRGAHVSIRGNEAYLLNMTIPPYQPHNVDETYDPTRARKLLLRKSEITTLIGSEKTKGLTIIPLSVYTKGRTIKVKIGVARGRKKFDKRARIKKRDIEREIRRTLKR